MKPSLPSYVLAFLSLLQTCHVYVLWPCEDTDGTCRGKEECIADGKGPLKFVREKRSCPPGLFCCQPPYNEDPCESELQGVCYDHQRCIDAGRTPVLKTPKGASGCPSQPKNIICCVSACGLPHFDPRMSSFGNTRGQHVVPHSWPWHVLLDEPPFHRCGGALITKQSVLTAAHCLQSKFVLTCSASVT